MLTDTHQLGNGRVARRSLLFGLGGFALAALSSCAGGASSASSNGGAATAVSRVNLGLNAEANAAKSATGTVVKMTDQNRYDPSSVTISVGGAVTWDNDSSTVHSATFDPSKATDKANAALPAGVQPFDSGLLQPHQSWSHTFTVAGTYKYFCVPHQTLGMTGEVIVK